MAGEKVLIVEDKVVLYGQPLEALLLKRGYQVVGIAPTTADALQLCADHRPDVVLMDLEIRPIDGAPLKSDEGVRAAKGVAKINEPGVIFMTAHHVSDSLMEAVAEASPRATFLQNPFSQEQLLGSLRLALLRRWHDCECGSGFQVGHLCSFRFEVRICGRRKPPTDDLSEAEPALQPR